MNRSDTMLLGKKSREERRERENKKIGLWPNFKPM